MTNLLCLKHSYFSLIVLLSISLLIIDSAIFYFLNHPHYFKENGVIENIQVSLLLLGLILYGKSLFTNKNYKGVVWLSTVICFGFLLREIDIEKLLPSITILVKGKGKVIMLASLTSIAIYWLIQDIKNHKLFTHIISPFTLCIVFCANFLIFSWLFDKEIFDLKYNLVFEEVSEINAYLLIVIATFFIPKKSSNK